MGQQGTVSIGQGQRKVVSETPATGIAPMPLGGLSDALRAMNPAPRPVVGQTIGGAKPQGPAPDGQFDEAIREYQSAGMPLDLILKGLLAAR